MVGSSGGVMSASKGKMFPDLKGELHDCF